MQKTTIIATIFALVIIALLFVSLFIYSLYPVELSENFSDTFTIDFNSISLYWWKYTDLNSADILYYDNVNGNGYIVAYYNLNGDITSSPFTSDILNPTLAIVYSTDIEGVQPRNFTSMSNYIYEHISITLSRVDMVKGFLLPPSLSPNLTTFDDPFYITRYLETEQHFPRFYEVSSLDFDIVVQQLNENSLGYHIYPIGNGSLNVPIDSNNFLSGALYSFSYTIKTLDYPVFDYEKDASIVGIFNFFTSLYDFGVECVEYVILLFGSLLYSFNPLIYLR
jgi:hypothetical protein